MSERIEILKTYKTYVNGQFPRSESGRIYKVLDHHDEHIANACRCSRKDVRDAVQVARKALNPWTNRSAYNRGQILYRIGEMLETRRGAFEDSLMKLGYKEKAAKKEVDTAIDRFIYYAGWTDKYLQVFGAVNPVSSQHFNFSIFEPTGVITIIAPEESPLLGLVSAFAPVIAGGNTCVILASESKPLLAMTLAEVLDSSDVPGGVVNILTGLKDELLEHFTSHMDVNGICIADDLSEDQYKMVDENAAINVKRVSNCYTESWEEEKEENPYRILDFQETKTTWHPVGY